MTLAELKKLDRDWITPAQAAPSINADPHWIRLQARKDPSKLGFSVIVIGTRTKIPRIPFIQYLGGEL